MPLPPGLFSGGPAADPLISDFYADENRPSVGLTKSQGQISSSTRTYGLFGFPSPCCKADFDSAKWIFYVALAAAGKPALEENAAFCPRNKRHSGVAPAYYFFVVDTYPLDGVNTKMLKRVAVSSAKACGPTGRGIIPVHSRR
jgi:hypothetical protein